MDRRRPLPVSLQDADAKAPRFGRRASDKGFAQTGVWFGRRATDQKAKVRHSLSFAVQVAAQISPEGEKAEPAPYAGAFPLRAGIVKDFKA